MALTQQLVLIRQGNFGHRPTEGRQPHGNGSRDEVLPLQTKEPRIAITHQKLEETRKNLSKGLQREHCLGDAFISDF